MDKYTKFRGAELTDRQTSELIGLARGVIADGVLSDGEIEYLHKWLAASAGVVAHPLLAPLLVRVEEILADGLVDAEERADLMAALMALTGDDFEVGEALKATTLPLCAPVPEIDFQERAFCFTGTFAFGKRAVCESAVTERGGIAGSLTKKTDFLVIGEYATDSWAQSSYGRKIEKAAMMRANGGIIRIIHEPVWRGML